MKAAWTRYEGPTWVVAAVIYGGWIALAVLHGRVPLALALPVAVYLAAWHSSLQHETIHAMRRVPRPLRILLAVPPLGLWFPYQWYRREHVRHHATRELGGPLDPESFAYDPMAVSRLPAFVRAILRANQTVAGRLVFGPALQAGRAYAGELRRLARGDRSRAGIWATHAVLVAALLWFLSQCGISPLAYVAFVAYPAASLGLVRSFAEHRASGLPAERTAVVESRSALSLLFLNNNLHAVHHAHPSLPWYEIPRQYRRDRSSGRLAPATPRLRGYRTLVRAWLLRPVDSAR